MADEITAGASQPEVSTEEENIGTPAEGVKTVTNEEEPPKEEYVKKSAMLVRLGKETEKRREAEEKVAELQNQLETSPFGASDTQADMSEEEYLTEEEKKIKELDKKVQDIQYQTFWNSVRAFQGNHPMNKDEEKVFYGKASIGYTFEDAYIVAVKDRPAVRKAQKEQERLKEVSQIASKSTTGGGSEPKSSETDREHFDATFPEGGVTW